MKRLKVGVVFGGRSVEHDVSVITAHQAMEALSGRHDVVPIYVDREGIWYTGEGLNDVEVYRNGRVADVGTRCILNPARGLDGLLLEPRRKGLGVEMPEIPVDVYVPAIHGTFGEDGTLQGLLELADRPYTGSDVTASALGMDKVAMKAAFRAVGLPVVPDVLVDVAQLDADPDATLDHIERELGYPAFVKPVKAGSSVGIGKATDRAALAEALDVARRYGRRILVERSMDGCIEINCSVIGGGGREAKASVCEQPVTWQEFLSFEDKYLRGRKGGEPTAKTSEPGGKSGGMASLDRNIPAPISDELTKQVQENALASFLAIDAAGVARIDSFVREETGETWVMEINTMPGSFAFYLWEASGLKFPDLMDELLEIALDTHRARQDLMFTFDSTLLDQKRGGPKSG